MRRSTPLKGLRKLLRSREPQIVEHNGAQRCVLPNWTARVHQHQTGTIPTAQRSTQSPLRKPTVPRTKFAARIRCKMFSFSLQVTGHLQKGHDDQAAELVPLSTTWICSNAPNGPKGQHCRKRSKKHKILTGRPVQNKEVWEIALACPYRIWRTKLSQTFQRTQNPDRATCGEQGIWETSGATRNVAR